MDDKVFYTVEIPRGKKLQELFLLARERGVTPDGLIQKIIDDFINPPSENKVIGNDVEE